MFTEVCTTAGNENDDISESVSNHAVVDFPVFAPFSGDFFKANKMEGTEYMKRDKKSKP
jgi:hypothetical protein